jgi:hypothetical protein
MRVPGMMYIVRITEGMIEEAHELEKQIPKDIRNSIRNGAGIFPGCLGQVACCHRFIDTYKAKGKEQEYNFDIVMAGMSVEVKTKVRTVRPLPHYEGSIPTYNDTQQSSKYLFVSLLGGSKTGPFTLAFIMGWISNPQGYFKVDPRWRFVKKGEYDPSNDWTALCDCWNITYSSLDQIPNCFARQKEEKCQ